MRKEYFGVDVNILQDLMYFYTDEGYFEWFFINLYKFNSYRQAYEAIEKEYRRWFGKNKFKTYNQFRVRKSRLLNK